MPKKTAVEKVIKKWEIEYLNFKSANDEFTFGLENMFGNCIYELKKAIKEDKDATT